MPTYKPKERISEDSGEGHANTLGVFIPTPEGFPYPLAHDGGQYQEIVNKVLVGNPYFFHAPDSPYIGLTVREQKALSIIRRGGTKAPAWWTHSLRPATAADYHKMFLGCVDTLVRDWLDSNVRLDRSRLYARLPFNFKAKWESKLPECVFYAFDDWSVVVGWKVEKVIDWLHAKGYSPFPAKDLKKQLWVVMKEQAKLDFYYEVATPQSIMELYGELVEGAKTGKVARKDQGRNYSRYRPRIKPESVVDSIVDGVKNNSENELTELKECETMLPLNELKE